jgi:predicted lactoylglutathione lyase
MVMVLYLCPRNGRLNRYIIIFYKLISNFSGGKFMQNLKRNINMGFRVNTEEQKAIQKRMEIAGIPNVRVYLLKMALMGQIITLDLADVRECSKLLRNIGNNLNQLAKRANEGGSICVAEVSDVQSKLGEIWEQQNKIIGSLTKILEVV